MCFKKFHVTFFVKKKFILLIDSIQVRWLCPPLLISNNINKTNWHCYFSDVYNFEAKFLFCFVEVNNACKLKSQNKQKKLYNI